MALPLEGMKVLDFTQIMAGPFCTMLLADMGADVVKVEKPGGGDDTRRMGPPFLNGESAAFLGINRNKRSIILNIKDEQGVGVAHRMAKEADVLIQNFRPGTLERIGLGYQDMQKLNPALIYCNISGFGNTGPYKDRGGFDLVAQGMSGLMSLTGLPDSSPVKVGVPITDLNAGMYATYGILSAYISRLKTGKGQLVDTSLLEAGIAYTFWESAIFFASGQLPTPMGSAHRLSAPYQAFPTSDGYINIGAANQANWERMCEAIDRHELLDDARFATNADRMQNLKELVTTLEETFATQNTAHWLDVLEKAGVPSGPINNIADVYADPQVQAREMMVEMEHPQAGRVRNIGIPVKLSETPGSIRRPAPTLGQHTDEVLAEFGYSSDEITKLRDSGAVA
ncbi:MAG: CoA transferase [Chloroflexi bacterium]|nr:CoA transferase [Chloroflexota bacterium]